MDSETHKQLQQLMSLCMSQSHSERTEKIVINPQEQEEVEEHRCRICYDSSKPMISVCSCSGSMTFVHEDCILDWITKKIEASERVEIPRCEICHEQYSARMKIGKRKVCPNILSDKISRLSTVEKVATVAHCLSLLVALIFMASFFFLMLTGSLFEEASVLEVLKKGYLYVVSQCYILHFCRRHYEKRRVLVEESMIQIVEVTLQPRVALRC